MKRLFVILLTVLIEFSCLSQTPYINKEKGITRILKKISHILSGKAYIDEKGDIIIDDRNLYGDNTLLLYYNSDNVTKSVLTYNSTGDTIFSVSNDTVVVDSTDHIIKGNVIRFTDPLIDPTYTIYDTLNSIDSLKVNQICTGNIGDEMYIGCDGHIVDQSNYENDGLQTTGIYQVKGIWIETDSSMWYSDGIDDYVGTGLSLNGVSKFTIAIWINVSSNKSASDRVITGGSLHFLKADAESGKYQSEVYIGGVKRSPQISAGGANQDEWHFIALIYDGDSIWHNVDGVDLTSIVCTGVVTQEANFDIAKRGSDFIPMYFDDLRIYNRGLSHQEILTIYQDSKHYNP